MKSDWLIDYIQNALRVDRAFSKTDISNFIDNYYGPPDLRLNLKNEKIQNFSSLADSTLDLLQRLPYQGYEKSRVLYFEKHLQALRTVTEMYSGVQFSFYQLVENVFDIQPTWIPEEEFERSLRLLDQALPGKGDVRVRYQSWQDSLRANDNDVERITAVMQAMLAEARRRTEAIIPLPEGEEVQLQALHGVNYGAANWYLGGYHSRLELNLDRSVYYPGLLYQMCHEGYPGHHTESCLKEYYIYRQKGWLEQSLYFTFGPQLVISEGIASLAPGMIFTPSEAVEWCREFLGDIVPLWSLDADLEKIFSAFTIASPDDLSSNLATLIEAGRKRSEILDYARAYTVYTDAQINDVLNWLESQMSRLYAFTYSHGKRLIEPLVTNDQRLANIRMLLTEQVTPSQLASLAA